MVASFWFSCFSSGKNLWFSKEREKFWVFRVLDWEVELEILMLWEEFCWTIVVPTTTFTILLHTIEDGMDRRLTLYELVIAMLDNDILVYDNFFVKLFGVFLDRIKNNFCLVQSYFTEEIFVWLKGKINLFNFLYKG